MRYLYIHTVCAEKRPTCFFVIGNSDRTWYTVCRINMQQNHGRVFTSPEQCLYTTLWNLKCLSDTCYHWVVTTRNSRIYPTSDVAPNSPDLNTVDYSMWGYASEGVQNTHHRSGRTETATVPDQCSLFEPISVWLKKESLTTESLLNLFLCCFKYIWISKVISIWWTLVCGCVCLCV